MGNIGFYILCLVGIIIGIWLVKKTVGCMVRSVITIVIIAVLAAIYFMYFR